MEQTSGYIQSLSQSNFMYIAPFIQVNEVGQRKEKEEKQQTI